MSADNNYYATPIEDHTEQFNDYGPVVPVYDYLMNYTQGQDDYGIPDKESAPNHNTKLNEIEEIDEVGDDDEESGVQFPKILGKGVSERSKYFLSKEKQEDAIDKYEPSPKVKGKTSQFKKELELNCLDSEDQAENQQNELADNLLLIHHNNEGSSQQSYFSSQLQQGSATSQQLLIINGEEEDTPSKKNPKSKEWGKKQINSTAGGHEEIEKQDISGIDKIQTPELPAFCKNDEKSSDLAHHLSSLQSTPQCRTTSQQKNHIFETPLTETREGLSQQSLISTPRKLLFQTEHPSNASNLSDQQSIVKQRIYTESTATSSSSIQVAFLQAQQNNNSSVIGQQFKSNLSTPQQQQSSLQQHSSNLSLTSEQNTLQSMASSKQSDESIEQSVKTQILETSRKLLSMEIKERKKAELALLKEWKNTDSQHLIEMGWAIKYGNWLMNQTDETVFSLPVPNAKLMEKGVLKDNLKIKKHYDIVSTKVYFLMKQLYGGGPDIPFRSPVPVSEMTFSKSSVNGSSSSLVPMDQQKSLNSIENHDKTNSTAGISTGTGNNSNITNINGSNSSMNQASNQINGNTVKAPVAASSEPKGQPAQQQKQQQQQPQQPSQLTSSQSQSQQGQATIPRSSDIAPLLISPYKTEPKLMLQVKGLYNQQNYCYLNATVQCLLSVPEFNAHFYQDAFNAPGTNPNAKSVPTRKDKKLVPIFSDLVKLYSKTPESKIIDLSLLKKAVRKPFFPEEQHDAQEFLRYVLSEIQDELNPKLLIKPSFDFKSSEEAYQCYLQYQYSIVDKLFAGQLVSSVRCVKCTHDSRTYDPFLDLSLSMAEGKQNQTIDECLGRFFAEEELSDDYKCEKCLQLVKAKKKVCITKTPYILTLHLKRFKTHPRKRKIFDFVYFPMEELSVDKFLGGENCGVAKYRLISLIVHSGSQDSGHYFAFVYRDNKWFGCDDSKFKEVPESLVMKSEAYLLFYRRIDDQSNLTQQPNMQNGNGQSMLNSKSQQDNQQKSQINQSTQQQQSMVQSKVAPKPTTGSIPQSAQSLPKPQQPSQSQSQQINNQSQYNNQSSQVKQSSNGLQQSQQQTNQQSEIKRVQNNQVSSRLQEVNKSSQGKPPRSYSNQNNKR